MSKQCTEVLLNRVGKKSNFRNLLPCSSSFIIFILFKDNFRQKKKISTHGKVIFCVFIKEETALAELELVLLIQFIQNQYAGKIVKEARKKMEIMFLFDAVIVSITNDTL